MFCFVRDELKLYNRISILNEECPSCGKFTHLIGNCPLFGIKPLKEKIIENFQAVKIFRRVMVRTTKIKSNALKMKKNNVRN